MTIPREPGVYDLLSEASGVASSGFEGFRRKGNIERVAFSIDWASSFISSTFSAAVSQLVII